MSKSMSVPNSGHWRLAVTAVPGVPLHSTVQMYRTDYHSTVQMYRIGYILPAGAVLYVDVVRPRPVDAVSETNTDTVQCGATTFKLAIKMYKCCQLVKFDFSFKKQ